MEAINGIKIFFMSDCDWVAAKDENEARKFYIKNCGLDEQDQAELQIDELTEEQFQQLVYNDEDEEPTSLSFASELQKKIKRNEAFPQIFASTEY